MISNISITPIKNMLKNALNIQDFSFKSHTSTAIIGTISITPIKNMLKNALNIQDFSFKSHTSTAIIGTNGAGKSTLINTILGIRSDYNFKA